MVKIQSSRTSRKSRKSRRVKILVQYVEIPKTRNSQVDKLARVKFALHFNAVAIEIARTIKRTPADEEREFQLEYDLLNLCISFLDLTLE